ncbi:MAG TPA: FIST N-terminal domain-containing protein [Streptosporangiaceae bacterium]|nr:FIST N-terminal domain-containing protein [Streptosporangiaceae bacterium]
MKAGAALVLTEDPGQAARQAVEQARAALGDQPPAFGVLFASQHYHVPAQALLAAVTERLGPLPLIGCVAEAVAGGSTEVESAAAVSLWLAAGVGPVETFSMEFLPTSSGGAFGGYRFEGDRPGVCLMICDPFTFPAEHLLSHLNENAAGTQVMGGMASGGLGAQRSRLFLDGKVLNAGAVGAWLPDAEIHPLVSQGCRPVGDPFTVTAAEGNLVAELGGRPAMTRLQDLAASLSTQDRQLLAQGVQVGMVIDEYGAERRQGDFLIRSILGAQPETGAIAVGDEVEVGQTLQFHVRDADSADQELRRLLEQETAALGGQHPAGALLFTCNGRGSRLFPKPSHDTGLIAEVLGDTPVAGFFCAGELGPVSGRNYLHTFTASIAVFPGQP